MAGGLFGTQAHAAAVRAEVNNRVAEAKDLDGLEAVTTLPYAQLEQLAEFLVLASDPIQIRRRANH